MRDQVRPMNEIQAIYARMFGNFINATTPLRGERSVSIQTRFGTRILPIRKRRRTAVIQEAVGQVVTLKCWLLNTIPASSFIKARCAIGS